MCNDKKTDVEIVWKKEIYDAEKRGREKLITELTNDDTAHFVANVMLSIPIRDEYGNLVPPEKYGNLEKLVKLILLHAINLTQIPNCGKINCKNKVTHRCCGRCSVHCGCDEE